MRAERWGNGGHSSDEVGSDGDGSDRMEEIGWGSLVNCDWMGVGSLPLCIDNLGSGVWGLGWKRINQGL